MKKIWIIYYWETKNLNIYWYVDLTDDFDHSKWFRISVNYNNKWERWTECIFVEEEISTFEEAEKKLINFVEENFRIDNEAWND